MADFFDKIAGGISKGVATVSTGSKTVLEKTKINNVIKTLEDEKRQLAEIIGNKVYNFCINNSEVDIPREEVANICNEISNRIVLIEENKAKIVALDAEMNQVMGKTSVGSRCVCGFENAHGAKFCAKCGNKLV